LRPPSVSIVLPTFNRLKYLRPAVQSIHAQTFTDWELIVADDGSDGETAAYLASLVDPPKIRVISLPHSGNPGAVRNVGWQAAQGEFIAFLDSDDLWLPQKLAKQVASLSAHPQRQWGHTAFATIDDSGSQPRAWPAAQGWVLESLIKMELVIAPASVIVKRRCLELLGGFDVRQRACEDYDLWLRLAAISELDGVAEELTLKRAQPDPFYTPAIVFEDRERALKKMLSTNIEPSLHSVLCRERARVAAGLARVHAICGGRKAALQTLLKSSAYSWGYAQWWLQGAEAAVRAAAPASFMRVARFLMGRSRAS
jgi:glycosyltransferase involved in cell wall biosynthesis